MLSSHGFAGLYIQIQHTLHVLKCPGFIQHPNQKRGNDRTAHGTHKEWDYIAKTAASFPMTSVATG